MSVRFLVRRLGALAFAGLVATSSEPVGAQEAAQAPLAITNARISIAGTTNVHDYTASTSQVRVTRVALADAEPGSAFWDDVVKPGKLATLEIAVPAATLASPKGDLDKNMHKALQVQQHPEITFRLHQLEPTGGATLKATGTLRIAGVEREVTLQLRTEHTSTAFVVRGEVPLLMTDYGITPPKAMLGMLKTNPKVTITFEATFAIPAS